LADFNKQIFEIHIILVERSKDLSTSLFIIIKIKEEKKR